MGRSTKADFTAIIVLLKNVRTRIMYVIAADLLHCRPGEANERILKYASMYRFSRFAVESNNFQELMVDNLNHRLQMHGLKMRIKSQHHSSQKIPRISSLEPYVSQGLVRFSRKHQDLLLQLTQFPLAKNDDGPDALEMAVDIARKPRTLVGGISVRDKNRRY
jgi:predicted phage terminase large subunit-like protein